jgi:tetratricopeptide (TPR) repeat protein
LRHGWLLLCGVLVASALVYAPSLRGGFVWDDQPLILNDEQVHSPANWPAAFARDFFAASDDQFKYGYYRPLVTLSYMLDWALWRDNPLGYRLTNLLWHLLATALGFWLMQRLAPGSIWPAVIGAALFGLHPIHTESVAWIAGRTDLLCAVFALATLLCWHVYLTRNDARWRLAPDGKKKKAPPPRTAVAWWIGSAACLFLSLLAKEMGAVALLVMPAMAYFLFFDRRWRSLRRLGWECATMAGAVALYLVLRVGLADVLSDTTPTEHTFGKALVTFPAAFGVYLGKLLAPVKLSAYLVRPYGLHSATDAIWLAAGLVLLLGLGALIARAKRASPGVAFAATALLLSFVPLANLVRISGPSDMGFVMAERFLYLPSFFLCLLIVVGAAQAVKTPAQRTVAAIVATLLIVGCGARTAVASRLWADEMRVYENALRHTTEAPLLWANLGAAYRRAGRLDEALAALRRAEAVNARVRSADPTALYNNLGTALASLGRLDEALAAFDQSVAYGKRTDRTQFNRGEALRLLGRTEEALAAYRAATAANPRYADPRLRTAQIALVRGQVDEAERELRAVLQYDAQNPDALAGLAHVERRRGHLPQALDLLQQALRVRPNDYAALMALGGVTGQMQRFTEALAAFERARQAAPDQPSPYVAIAAARFRAGERERAKEVLDEARRKFPQNAEVLLGLLNYHYETGDLAAARAILAEALAVAPQHPQVMQYQKALAQSP